MVNIATLRLREEVRGQVLGLITVGKERLEVVDKAQRGLEAQAGEAIALINSNVEQIIKAVRARGVELVNELESATALELGRLQNHSTATATRLAGLRSIMSNIEEYGGGELERVKELIDVQEEFPLVRSIRTDVDTTTVEEHLQGWGAINLIEAGCQDSSSEVVEDDDFEFLQDDSLEGSTSSLTETMAQIAVGEKREDLSVWLRPKRREEPATAVEPPPVVPVEVLQQRPATRASSSSSSSSTHSTGSTSAKRKLIDFPPLKLDPTVWLPMRKFKDPRTLNTVYMRDPDYSMSERDLIPPSYALPYPFWVRGGK